MMSLDYERQVMVVARTGRPKLATPRKDGIFIRLTEQEHIDIKEYAAKHNLTITQTLVSGFYSLMEKEGSADK